MTPAARGLDLAAAPTVMSSLDNTVAPNSHFATIVGTEATRQR